MKSRPERGSVVMSLTRSMPPGASDVAQALEHAPLVVGRQVVHHVEHVGGGERALERRVPHVAHVEAVLVRGRGGPRRRARADAPRVGIDSDDAPPRVRLPEVRGEEAEAAPDVEDAPLVREE